MAGRAHDTTDAIDDTTAEMAKDIPAIELDLAAMKAELTKKCVECQERGMAQTFKWLSEILFSLRDVKAKPADFSGRDDGLGDEREKYLMAKAYFDLKEYDRCAFFTSECREPRVVFLHFYARYLGGEKKRLDNQTDTITSIDAAQLVYLKDLRSDLHKLYVNEDSDDDDDDCRSRCVMDGYLLYLYGVVLKRLGLNDQAKAVLIEAIEKEPCNWGAWLELSFHVGDRTSLQALDLPAEGHWTRPLFLAHCYLELLLNERALDIYVGLQKGGLDSSTYIMAQVAIAFHNKRDLDQAVDAFKQLAEADPYRLDNLDTYSNVLYVKEQRVELAHLAHRLVQIDKYRPETCCVVGNYYSLRSQHEKAVVYFQRALKLNPNYLSAWTLMGHEFMELKNRTAAIQSYRHAIEVNPRDYRAWYGLGQTYEILKMHFYCLYYYKKAQELRPNDSRMLMALGESYEKLDRLTDALKCYWKAHCLGDIERTVALYQLARLYERTDDADRAACAYSQFVDDAEADGVSCVDDRDQLSRAYRYLAAYHVRDGRLDEGYRFAHKCTEFADTREEGKALLKEIASKRAGKDEMTTVLDEEHPNVLQESDMFATPANDATTAATRNLQPVNLTYTP